MPNRLIPPVSEATSITKVRYVKLFNTVFEEINKINQLYDKFFESSTDRAALATEIEQKLDLINERYLEFFGKTTDDTLSKSEELNNQILEIQKFHSVLTGSDGSLKHEIEEARKKVISFYTKLFVTNTRKNDGGIEKKINLAIDSIVSFNEELNKSDIGHKDKIEKAKVDILAAHSDLFTKDVKSKKSKISLLNEQISVANKFHHELKNEIRPYITDQQKNIDNISREINDKRIEVDSLLSDTTIQTLSENYKEAMHLYGDPVYRKGSISKLASVKRFILNTCTGIKHLAKFLGSYSLFIGPLLLIGWLFIEGPSQTVFDLKSDSGIEFSGSEYIVYKLTIALPLLWVSYFGQKSISHKRRLFEEYNHKYRVLQMYMLFTGKESTYPLDKETQKKLEDTLIETIAKNPSEVYGKDETMLDKIIDLFKSRNPANRDSKNAKQLD